MEKCSRGIELEETRKKYIKYLGKLRVLEESVDIDGMSDSEVIKAVVRFYERNSKQIAKERTKIYQEKLKVKPKSIAVEKNNSRWGSCNTKREITYHYLISTLSMELIDYIVIHELCHLHHMNHDRSFWRKVGSIIPDYKEKVAKLDATRLGIVCPGK